MAKIKGTSKPVPTGRTHLLLTLVATADACWYIPLAQGAEREEAQGKSNWNAQGHHLAESREAGWDSEEEMAERFTKLWQQPSGRAACDISMGETGGHW